MTPELAKWITSLGVGGILAAGMFWVYRKDMQFTQERLLAITTKMLDTLQLVNTSLAQCNLLLGQLMQRLDRMEGKADGSVE